MPQAAISDAKKRRQNEYEATFHTKKPLTTGFSLFDRNEKTMATHLRELMLKQEKAAEEKTTFTINQKPSQAGVFGKAKKTATTISKHGLEIPLPRSQQSKP